MKAGDVIMVQALKALHRAGVLDQMSLSLVFTGDEESSGVPVSRSRAELLSEARRSTYAVGFEDGADDFETVVTARRGMTSFTLKSTGVAAHSSLVGTEGVGDGAIFEAARALNDIRQATSSEKGLSVSPALILGGNEVHKDARAVAGSARTKLNIVPRETWVRGEIRALSPAQLKRTRETLAAIAAHSLPETHSEIRFVEGKPPLPETAAGNALLASFSDVSRALGLGNVRAADPRRAGGADVSHIGNLVKGGVLDGLGLPGKGTHTAEETADLSLLTPLTQRAAVFLYRLSQGA